MENSNNDIWNIGSYYKEGIWAYYVISNFVGVFLCVVLMYSVYKNPKQNATDVMVAGLCYACIMHSITCGTQCLINMVYARFQGGELACQIEAIAHISSILTQFFCVAGIAVRSYLIVVRKHDLSSKFAFRLTVAVWVLFTVLTGVFSLFSPIYLMSNGAYCFFGFTSFAIAGWLLPGLVLAVLVMTVCYYKIWRHFKQTSMLLEAALKILAQPKSSVTLTSDKTVEMIDLKPAVDSDNEAVRTAPGSGYATPHTRATSVSRAAQTETTRREVSHMDVARRSTLFIAILLLGWGFAGVTAIYELSVGPATEWLVTAVGVGAVSFSWWVPVAYTYTSDFHKKTMKKLLGWACVPLQGREWWREAWETPVKRLSALESTSDNSYHSKGHRPASASPVCLDTPNSKRNSANPLPQTPTIPKDEPPCLNSVSEETASVAILLT